MGRRRIHPDTLATTVGTRLPGPVIAELDKVAERRQLTRSALVAEFVREKLAEQDRAAQHV